MGGGGWLMFFNHNLLIVGMLIQHLYPPRKVEFIKWCTQVVVTIWYRARINYRKKYTTISNHFPPTHISLASSSSTGYHIDFVTCERRSNTNIYVIESQLYVTKRLHNVFQMSCIRGLDLWFITTERLLDVSINHTAHIRGTLLDQRAIIWIITTEHHSVFFSFRWHYSIKW